MSTRMLKLYNAGNDFYDSTVVLNPKSTKGDQEKERIKKRTKQVQS